MTKKKLTDTELSHGSEPVGKGDRERSTGEEDLGGQKWFLGNIGLDVDEKDEDNKSRHDSAPNDRCIPGLLITYEKAGSY